MLMVDYEKFLENKRAKLESQKKQAAEEERKRQEDRAKLLDHLRGLLERAVNPELEAARDVLAPKNTKLVTHFSLGALPIKPPGGEHQIVFQLEDPKGKSRMYSFAITGSEQVISRTHGTTGATAKLWDKPVAAITREESVT
jgi:hypothetical protein